MRVTAPPALLIVSLYLAGCGEEPTSPTLALSRTITTEHYVFHLDPRDQVDTAWQEAYYRWVVAELGITAGERLDYFKYRDRAHLAAITGRQTNGFAEAGTTRFHTIWPIDNHEGVHTLVSLHLGTPPALFNEGIAVAMQTDPTRGNLTPKWSGQDLHALARGYLLSGQLPDLSQLMENRDFFSFNDQVTYPSVGSFVRYLLDRYGMPPFRALVSGTEWDDPASVTRDRFLRTYARPLAEVWNAWVEWLLSAQP